MHNADYQWLLASLSMLNDARQEKTLSLNLMQRQQHFVEQSVMLQDVDPGINSDQERGPERHDHQHHRDRLPPLRQPRHAVGDRIADQKQDRGRDRRDDEAAQIGQHVQVIRNQ